ncbi:MAG: hypothetical protein HS111_33530 [Kofleriaceae bacterium]|nr:hypothetical protein [Kofleriaceae bacterium]
MPRWVWQNYPTKPTPVSNQIRSGSGAARITRPGHQGLPGTCFPGGRRMASRMFGKR